MIKISKAPKIVIFLSVGVLAFVLVFLAIYVLGRDKNAQNAPEYDFIFHEVDFETDILSDPDYLALDRSISFKQGNQKITIDRNFRSENGTIEFMLDYLDCIIAGDYKAYSEFFSKLYFETDKIPEIFTMQRIYEITIEFLGETPAVESNKNYTEYRLSLDYKINRNDGTLRNDMGSDCFRTQYFLITNREGELKIDTIKSFDIVKEIPSEINPEAVYVCCVVFVLLVVTAIFVVTRKKTSRRNKRSKAENQLP